MTWDITAKFAHFIFFVNISVVPIANLLRDAQCIPTPNCKFVTVSFLVNITLLHAKNLVFTDQNFICYVIESQKFGCHMKIL
jgi:hypothetical protein